MEPMKSKLNVTVPVQKGHIVANPMTMKQMPHQERLQERKAEIRKRVDGQTTEYHSPSQKRR